MPKEAEYDTFEFGDAWLLKAKSVLQLSHGQRSPMDLVEMIRTLERNPKIKWMVKSCKIQHQNGSKPFRLYALFRDVEVSL